MNFLISICVIFFSMHALAQDFTTSRGPGGELILTGSNCSALLKQREAICEWKKTEDKISTPLKESSSCKIVSGKSVLSISTCLPKFTKEYHQKKLSNFGPNCWGTAMSFSQISTVPRFIWSEEMSYWLESPLCRKLGADESFRPGDVLNMYAPESLMLSEFKKNDGSRFVEALNPKRYQAPKTQGYTGFQRLLHSEIYLSPQIAFGKDSPIKEDQFNFHPLSETYARPRDDKECMENQSLEPYLREYDNAPKDIRNSHCAYFSNVYRCSDAPDYFSNQSLSEEEMKILTNIKKLQGIQQKLFGLVVSPTAKISEIEIDKILKLVGPIISKNLVELKKTGIEKNREMLLAWEYFSAAGLKKSLAQARLIPDV